MVFLELGTIKFVRLRRYSVIDRYSFYRVHCIFMSRFRSDCPAFLTPCPTFCDTGAGNTNTNDVKVTFIVIWELLPVIEVDFGCELWLCNNITVTLKWDVLTLTNKITIYNYTVKIMQYSFFFFKLAILIQISSF